MAKRERKTAKHKEEAIAPTFLAEIREILKKKQFDFPPPKQPVKPGEKVIGVLNDEEKAILALAHKKYQAFKAICGNCQCKNKGSKVYAKCKKALRLHYQFETLGKLVWPMFFYRLGIPSENVEVAIRQGFQVVGSQEIDLADMPGISLAKLLGLG